MNADDFEIDDNSRDYFQFINWLVIYGYYHLKRSGKLYSRNNIRDAFIQKMKRDHPKIELEDYLRNQFIKYHLTPNKRLFGLDSFVITSGSDEDEDGIPMGRADIAFKTTIASRQLETSGYIFECKRVNKYDSYITGYVVDGMLRFVEKQYYADSSVTTSLAGMIGFVEVDINEKEKGREPLENIFPLLQQKVEDNNVLLEVQQNLIPFVLNCPFDADVSSFPYCYESKHLRKKHEPAIISIYHLLLDYYDLLVD